MALCCCSLAGTAACKRCRNNPYVITSSRTFRIELDDEESQIQAIKDAKKRSLEVLKKYEESK